MVTTVLLLTGDVVMVKFTDVCPAGTVTTPGALAAGPPVSSVACTPPAGAGLFKRTVPVALVPPTTVVGLTDTAFKMGGAFGSGLTVTKIDCVTPPALANTLPPLGLVETA